MFHFYSFSKFFFTSSRIYFGFCLFCYSLYQLKEAMFLMAHHNAQKVPLIQMGRMVTVLVTPGMITILLYFSIPTCFVRTYYIVLIASRMGNPSHMRSNVEDLTCTETESIISSRPGHHSLHKSARHEKYNQYNGK